MDNKLKTKPCKNTRNLFKGCLSVILVVTLFYLMVGCTANIFEKKKESKEPTVSEDVYFEGKNIGGMKRGEVLEIVKEQASRVDTEAKDAILNTSTWEILGGRSGLRVNLEKTMENILTADKGQKVELVVEVVHPNKTKNVLGDSIVEVSSYTTPIIDQSPQRMNNIELAAEKINNTILAPGEEFSFNKVVGRRDEDTGYEYAPIIIRTEEGPKKEDGVGGGVCQLSTTIFNAIEEIGLEITERHTHSSEVTYVPEGEDAAVSYGSVDLKFNNSRQHPIMLKVFIENDALTVKVLENRS